MGLKQRKRIKNMSRYADGKDGKINQSDWSASDQDWLDKSAASFKKQLEPQFNPQLNPLVSKVPSQPQLNVKSPQSSGQLASAGISGLQGATSIASNFMNQTKSVPTGDQMMAESGTSEGSVMGINYTRQNSIDSGKYESEVNSSGLGNTMSSTVSGASAGASIAGPWGAVAGGAVGLVSGLVGWGSSKRKLQKRLHDVKQLTSRTNTFNRSGAMSTGLQNEYYQDYGNTQDDVLYS